MDMSSSKSKNATNKIQGHASIKSEKDYKKMVMKIEFLNVFYYNDIIIF